MTDRRWMAERSRKSWRSRKRRQAALAAAGSGQNSPALVPAEEGTMDSSTDRLADPGDNFRRAPRSTAPRYAPASAAADRMPAVEPGPQGPKPAQEICERLLQARARLAAATDRFEPVLASITGRPLQRPDADAPARAAADFTRLFPALERLTADLLEEIARIEDRVRELDVVL
ncbi:MAG TPA: hypothetical protein VHY10_16200 [Xanthobacteraceae bacterium]|jgi:hypothetical protein|nr:hypothetical protein [Xanthobacteraceae bacterium]